MVEERHRCGTLGTFGIYLSLILFCKKIDIYSSFFRIKSLRACWIVLQRWAWGRQRGIASSLSLISPFLFLLLLLPGQTAWKFPKETFKKEKKRKDRLAHYSEYPKICPIFISSCLVCARACYTPHPSTPTHGKHCFFIYFHIFVSFFLPTFVAFSV